jgi:hypothetical protein
MGRERKQYRNRVIEVTTFALKTGGFTTHFSIEDHTAGTHVGIALVESGKTFASDAEAFEYGFQAGQRKIDTE